MEENYTWCEEEDGEHKAREAKEHPKNALKVWPVRFSNVPGGR
jgi:hypothetical protein